MEREDAGWAFGVPAEVLDEGLAAQWDLDRAHGERELGQLEVALAHRERVHVARLTHALGGEHARTAVRRLHEEAVAVARAHARRQVDECPALWIAVRM